MTHGNDLVTSIALTFRPLNGLTQQHDIRLRQWLEKNCAQWEIFQETIDGDAKTLHLHGRLLLRNPNRRMDHVKVSLIGAMNLVLAEKNVLRKGIKWLYDDWDYAGKDGHVWSRCITSEDAWVYADPDLKYEKKKNAWIDLWLSKIVDEFHDPEQTDPMEVERLISIQMALNVLEFCNLDTLKKKCAVVARCYNLRQIHNIPI